jgi:protoheme IX farnesyltransferase
MIGWAAVTGDVSAVGIALFLLIFLWTPPHFWALALCRAGDYERVGVPMLPNVVGPVATCRQIVGYSLLLVPASLAPLVIPGVGFFYATIAVVCDGTLLWRAFALHRLGDAEESPRRKAAMAMFGYSILYMFVLFAALLAQVAINAVLGIRV